jgi:peptidyl-dipeptidase Dcp
MSHSNPLLAPWTTPFGLPPFDLIRPEHFEPAFAAAITAHLAEIAAIGDDPAPPSFANTIEALERSGRALSRVRMVFDNVVVSLGGPALEAVDRTMSPVLAQHHSRVALDARVFARVDALHRQRAALTLRPDQARLLDRTHLGFVRSGAALDPAAKARLTEISARLAVLHTAFGQNVLHDEKAWHLVLGEADLAGLPDFVIDGAARAAAERGLPGHVAVVDRAVPDVFHPAGPAPGRA